MRISSAEMRKYMKSIWSENTEIAQRPSLESDKTVEIAVIGAGMAGILTSYFLKKQGLDVILIEADRIASGQTKNTTAKITSQHGMIYDSLVRKFGEEKARLYASGNQSAIDWYQEIIEKEKIDCDFERLSAYLYSTLEEEKIRKEAKAAACLGLPAYFCEKTPLSFKTGEAAPFEIKGAVCFEEQAQFHPLRFIKALSKKLTVYENTMVLRVRGHKIWTDHGKITARKIIFATHYPFVNIPGWFFLRQHQERSYVIAYSGIRIPDGMYYSADEEGLSFRSASSLFLAGGGKHRSGKNEQEENYESIREKMRKYFPEAREEAHWSAQDCITHDGLPLIGKYSVFRPYWYVLTGFGKWGMTFSMLGAKILADRIAGKENPWGKLFSPQRWSFLPSFGKFMTDAWESCIGLLWVRHLFEGKKESDLENGQGGIVRRGIKRYGCYKGEDGTFYRVSLQCPHMGCELSWNQDELSWDCPCHGSRFDYHGNLIDNPSKKGLENIL